MTEEKLTREVDYRLCKWVLGNLQMRDLLTAEETKAVLDGLKEHFSPPFLAVDVAEAEKIGDGVIVDER